MNYNSKARLCETTLSYCSLPNSQSQSCSSSIIISHYPFLHTPPGAPSTKKRAGIYTSNCGIQH